MRNQDCAKREKDGKKTVEIDIRTLTGLAILTAIVVVLQALGSFIKFGPFSISLVLIPIVIGAALYGPLAGTWLGFVFSLVVMFMDTALFFSISPVGTILTVMAKGTLAGFFSGLSYRLLRGKKIGGPKGPDLGVFLAAFVCPVVNTGIFLLGCLLFFLPTIREWGVANGYDNVVAYMFFGLAGGNFLFELLFNLVLSPAIVFLVRLGRKEQLDHRH